MSYCECCGNWTEQGCYCETCREYKNIVGLRTYRSHKHVFKKHSSKNLLKNTIKQLIGNQ